ncbi:uncharacterized protein A4U43_C04F24150 [Asparagus officinalis]|uniref:Uncharacterized protein n=1 Tax=Asparagus officinalis TaxID=4686 RepID=A0A5P1F800_ASPOF|nr:uncharacterized protein A4U43_C04F24150 [Asparagus officinalis]
MRSLFIIPSHSFHRSSSFTSSREFNFNFLRKSHSSSSSSSQPESLKASRSFKPFAPPSAESEKKSTIQESASSQLVRASFSSDDDGGCRQRSRLAVHQQRFWVSKRLQQLDVAVPPSPLPLPPRSEPLSPPLRRLPRLIFDVLHPASRVPLLQPPPASHRSSCSLDTASARSPKATRHCSTSESRLSLKRRGP